MRTDHKIIQGDVLDGLRTLPDNSVHCVVTSPPYYALRNYNVDNQIGLEPTVDIYVQKLVEVFREVKRVLRNDGTCWLVLGDSYAGSGVHAAHHKNPGLSKAAHRGADVKTPIPKGLKAKDLIGVPWRVAFALQSDGWYIRNEVIWQKPNPMPSSAKDRMTLSHETIFFLTKRPKYYYDMEAVREPHSAANQKDYDARQRRGKLGWGDGKIAKNTKVSGVTHYAKVGRSRAEFHNPNGRNRRTVWTIPLQPTKDAHFATFPERLVEPCIQAGTSERGCCVTCGAPWERILEKDIEAPDGQGNFGKNGSKWVDEHQQSSGHRIQKNMNALRALGRDHDNPFPVRKTIGWKPTCTCGCAESDVIPCTVLDPFMGSGTVALVARNLNCSSVGCELNPAYIDIYKTKLDVGNQDPTESKYVFEKS